MVWGMTRRKTARRVLAVLAPLLALAGALTMTSTNLEWRALIGWGLIILGLALLMARAWMSGLEQRSTEG